MIPYTRNEQSITYYVEGRQKTFASDHPNFQRIVEAVLMQDIPLLKTLTNLRAFVARVTFGDVVITEDDDVLYKGTNVPEYLATRIIASYEENPAYVGPMIEFAEKLMGNPNLDVREDLYAWLERGKMPIYPDGDFAAYKLVRSDFRPIANGPYGKDQSPGTLVQMPREECDEDRDNTCSYGLHFCSYEYLPIFQDMNYGKGNKVILLKINPANVVSIPTDYNLSKGRTCEFYVVEEIPRETIEETFANIFVIEDDTVWQDHDEEDADELDFSDYMLDIPYILPKTPEDDNEKELKHIQLHYVRITPGSNGSGGGKTVYDGPPINISWEDEEDIPEDFLENQRKTAPFSGALADWRTKNEIAKKALKDANGNRTYAASILGIPRSTLYGWLNKRTK